MSSYTSKWQQPKMRKKSHLMLLVGIALVISMGIMPAAVWGKDIKVLRIGIGIDPDTLVPFQITTMIPFNIAQLIYEPILQYGENGELIPNLATSWKFSPDGKTFTIKLRKGVKFTDGSDFNAYSHKNYIDMQLNPKIRAPFRFFLAAIKNVETPDAYTVKFNLKSTFAPMAEVTALGAAMSLKATQPFDINKLRKEHVGAGPYKLVEWVKGERLVLVRNENYWGKRPTVDKIIYRVIPESATRIAMLRSGELDISYSPSPPDIKSLEASPDFNVARPLSTRMIFIGMNTQKGFTKNKYFRQALNYAIDKKAITERVLFGIAKPLEGTMPPSLFGYSRMDNQYEYNPEKAKALLKKANFPPNTEISLISPVGRYNYDKQIAETVQAYLQNIGVNAKLRTYDWPTYQAMTRKPLDKTELELFLLGWGAPYYDADFMTFMFFSSYVQPPRGLNSSFYSNKEFDKLTYMARVVLDKNKRKALYKKATEILWDDAPVIWLHVEPFSIAYSSKFKGIQVLSHEKCYPQYMTYR
ncbi:MAG: hypothetical protein HN580_07725 [Deltaproteobacteria bacterium]|nr:hypothetical protein [Deltaproteobacteria bacterium]MBT7888894.1 hypothetical protein [Deltaproteobacteria bacterium]